MADTEKLIKIIFEGVDKTSDKADSIGGRIEKLGNSFKDIAGPVASLGNSILTVDKYLAALAAGGLAYAFVKAMELETAIVNLDKVLSEQESSSLPGLVDRMSEFADAYGFTAASAVASAAEFRKASFELEDSAHLAELSAKLVIGASDAQFQSAQATGSLISLLKGFKVEQKDIVNESTHMADVLNKLADSYATTVSELSNGLQILAPISDSLGYSFDEMAGLLIPVIEIFGSGSESANGLKTSLLSIADPTKEVADTLGKYGIALKDSNGKQKDVKQLLDELLPTYNSLDKAQQVQLASMIAGKDQAAKFSALLNGMNTALDATAIAAKEAGGSLEKELARGLGTTEVQVQRFTAAFANLGAAIGMKFQGSAKEIVKGATDIQIALRTVVEGDGFKAIFDFLNESGMEIEKVFQNIAKNLPEAMKGVDFSALTDSLNSLKGNILDVFGDIDLSTTEGLTSAVQLVIDTIDTLIGVTDGILEAWQPLFDLIGETIDYFNDMDAGTKELVGNLMGAAQQIVLFGGALTVLGLGMKGVGTAFGIFGKAAKVAESDLGAISTAAEKSAGRMRDAKGRFVKAADAISASTLKFHEQSGLISLADKIKNLAGSIAGPAGLVFAAGAVGYAIGTLINQIPGVKELTQELFNLGGQLVGMPDVNVTGDTQDDIRNKAEALLKYRRNIEEFQKTAEKKVEISFEIDVAKIEEEFEKIKGDINKQRFELQVKMDKEANRKLFEDELNELQKEYGDAIEVSMTVELDSSAQEALKQIEEIDDQARELMNRKNEIQVYTQFLLQSGEVPPNELAQEFEAISKSLDDLSREKKAIQLTLEDNDSFQKVEDAKSKIDELTGEVRILRLQSEVNEGKGLGEIVDEIQVLEDGSYYIELKPELQGKGVEDVEEKIDKLSEDRKFVLGIETKKMEEETKRIVAQVEASSKIIQDAMKYKFELDIKQAEIDLEKVTQAFESTKEVLIAVTQASADMFGAFSTDFDTRTLWLFQDQLRQNLEIQREQADQQERLNQEILKELELKNKLREKFINGDDALLRVSVDESLDADLTAFVRALIPRLQIWGSENDVSLLIEATT